MKASRDIKSLLDVMAALRTPVTGCPWDLEQDFASIAPYTLEEAHEVADAIARGDMDDLRDELGDLLLQVVYHARMADEIGEFDFGDVVEAVTAKMIRRHPHVFGDKAGRSVAEVNVAWDEIKAQEKADRRTRRAARGLPDDSAKGQLDGVPPSLPSLSRALKLQQKAAKVGFDWGAAGPVLDKIEEEIGELRAAIAGGNPAEAADEFGDILFALVNLGRHLKVEPEAALRATNEKFRRRFAHIEARLAEQDRTPDEASLDEMEALWQEAKTAT
ncbi:MAG: nucleoside triphosphate pyrophosphohydrolase [Brucellaceae bacterium]|nr:nucleoside triphosphate pyrophosphohydrolase [Brucellaceae bacterium]